MIAGAGRYHLREVAKLARGLTLRDRPVHHVLPAWVTHQFLRILPGRATIANLAEVLLLRFGGGFAGRDCGQLVLADPARRYLVLTGRRIEIPSTVGILV